MKITLLGDVAFTGILSDDPQSNKTRFKEISEQLVHSDLVIANLEVPLFVPESRNEFKNFIHYSLEEPTADLLKRLNISCVSLANNHIFDCKMGGLKLTINLLDTLGIEHTGAGWKKEHIEPVILSLENSKIGFLAYVDKSTNPKTERFPELFINYFDTAVIKSDINNLKSSVDKIICSIHWGNDYSFYPTPQQITLARGLIDAGADIIMGHHPHTRQPYERYKEGYIFYSLGGITFGDYSKDEKSPLQAVFRKTKIGLLADYDLKKDSFSFISTHEKKGNVIRIIKGSYERWSRKKWRLYRIKYSSVVTEEIFDFKELVLDRVYEYFFGYYKKPFERLFQFQNLKKIKILIKDYKTKY